VKYRIISGILLLLVNSFLILSQHVKGGDTPVFKRNCLFLEGGGYHVLGSIGYERLLIRKDRVKCSLQANFGMVDYSLSGNIILFRGKHHLEFSTAAVIPHQLIYEDNAEWYPTWKIGYRFQKAGGRLVFRSGFGTTILGNDWHYGADMYLWVWPSIDIGWAFN
jgi:hypothetical protein